MHRAVLEERRTLGHPVPLGVSLSALGRTYLMLGRYPEALGTYRQASEIFERLEDLEESSYALLGVGRCLSRLGDITGAAQPLRKALQLRERSPNAVAISIARLAVAENHLQLKQLETALQEARKALFDLQLLPGRSAVIADAQQLIGRILLELRRHAEAARAFGEAAAEHRRLGALEAAVLDLTWWLEGALGQQDDAEVARLLREVEELLSRSETLGQREVVEFRLFRAYRRLARAPEDQRQILRHLRQAYHELLRKASFLDQEKRHSFLYRVPEHEAIVAAASEHGISLPELPVTPVSGL